MRPIQSLARQGSVLRIKPETCTNSHGTVFAPFSWRNKNLLHKTGEHSHGYFRAACVTILRKLPNHLPPCPFSSQLVASRKGSPVSPSLQNPDSGFCEKGRSSNPATCPSTEASLCKRPVGTVQQSGDVRFETRKGRSLPNLRKHGNDLPFECHPEMAASDQTAIFR